MALVILGYNAITGAVETGTAIDGAVTVLVLDPADVGRLERAITATCEGVFNRDSGDASNREDD